MCGERKEERGTYEVEELVCLACEAALQSRVEHGRLLVVRARLESTGLSIGSKAAKKRGLRVEVARELLELRSVGREVACEDVEPEASGRRELHLVDEAHGRGADVARGPGWR